MRERHRLRADLAYLTENKITLLRGGAYDAVEYHAEVERLRERLTALSKEQEHSAAGAAAERLRDVFNLSELLKEAKDSYKTASSARKRDLVISIVSELIVSSGNVAKIGAKEAFRTLLNRPRATPCGEIISFARTFFEGN